MLNSCKEQNFEYLRAISCISVILLHCATEYTEEAFIYTNISRIEFFFCDFIQIITRTAVPCFIMLSGAFILDKKHINAIEFYKKSFIKLGIPTLIFSIVSIFFRFIRGDSTIDIIKETLQGKPLGHMWYMYMLIGMYAVIPLVLKIKNRISEIQFNCFSIILILIGILLYFLIDLPWPLEFLYYLGYFTIGNVIRKMSDRLKGNFTTYIFLSMLFLLYTLVLNEISFSMNMYVPAYYRNPNYPTIVIASILFFIAFSKMKLNKNILIDCISKNSLIIYLSHPFVLMIIRNLIKIKFDVLPTPYIYVPTAFVTTLILSYISSKIYSYIYELIFKT